MTAAGTGRGASTRRRAGLAIAVLAITSGLLALAAGSTTPVDAEPFLRPGLRHLLGTDDLGRDVLREVLRGLRTSLVLGTTVTLVALAVGLAVGLAAGMGSPWLDELLMRGADTVSSLPTLMVAILVSALYGGSTTALILVLGLTRWPVVARLVRAEAASLRERDFVRAARALGGTPLHIARIHVLPHAATAALAGTGILFGGAVVAEAALAFVGLGDPSVTSLGQLASNGFAFMVHAPWMWLAPTAVIVVLTGTVAALTDRLTADRGPRSAARGERSPPAAASAHGPGRA